MSERKWKFRDDMLGHYINGTSDITFKEAEDRLNYLEDKASQAQYHINGYDKDAGVYESLCSTPLPERAVQIARALLQYHMNVKELRRIKTNEPFDWFVITDNDGKTVKVFTPEEPNGFIPV